MCVALRSEVALPSEDNYAAFRMTFTQRGAGGESERYETHRRYCTDPF